jgi:hypothetical protein
MAGFLQRTAAIRSYLLAITVGVVATLLSTLLWGAVLTLTLPRLVALLATFLSLLPGTLAAGLLTGFGLILTALPALLPWSAVFLRLLIAALVVLAQLAALGGLLISILITIVRHTSLLDGSPRLAQ